MHPDGTSAPLIGIIGDQKTTPSASSPTGSRAFVGTYDSYLGGLIQAGALPVIVPPNLATDTLRGIYARLDGILFSGGGDVDPAYYGVTDYNAEVCEVVPVRDSAELALARWAAADDLPLLGICRGHQVLNVALGGTLYWDIPTELPDALTHDPGDLLPLDHFSHDVSINTTSQLASILGETRLPTNSRHHQAVRELGQGLVACAFTDDGLIEGIEAPDRRFLLSVQWHPENLYPESAPMRHLFEALVEAAVQRRQARQTVQETSS